MPQPRNQRIRPRPAGTLLRATALCALLLTSTQAIPYSVQSHEQLIDLAWKQSIRPILLKHFPTLTEAQIQEAHAYAYGGCAIQDFGYYPFGNVFFSDLTHYVRAGDFVLSLLRNAETPDELAFAIGALSHYIGDTIGHGAAVNYAVPIEFPKLEQRYGSIVNYAQNPHAHVQTEFAFDINQLSKRRFAPSAYLKFVGLEVSNTLIRKAFFETYGLNLKDIIGSKETSIRVYRRAVRSFIPNIARAETILHKKNFPTDTPSPDLSQLRDDLLQASADNNWEAYRKNPGFGSHLYAGFIFILPKVGALKLLAIKGPNQQTEDLYVKSMNRSIKMLRRVLNDYDHLDHYLVNRDLDTGEFVKPGGYPLTDKTYAKLLSVITRDPGNSIPAQLKHDLIAYYADPQAPIITKNNPNDWAKVQTNLKTLATMKTIGDLDPIFEQIDANNSPLTAASNQFDKQEKR
ncbi:MAG: zinc dependent phospholipase C family protein [Edaphobacter sp.]